MRHTFLTPFLCLAGWLLAGAAWAAAPLLTPTELQTLRTSSEPRIVDLRPPADYLKQHLPGAVSAPYGRWRGPASNPGELPPMTALTALVQELGLTPQTHAVIVYAGTDATDFGSAARVYWTLKSLGMQQLSILNGGLKAWQAAGLPVSAQPHRVAASSWQPAFSTRWLTTQDEIKEQLNGQDAPGALLVDSRPPPFFEGSTLHGAAKAAGTLPGAVNLDSNLFFEPRSASLMDPAQLAAKVDVLPDASGQPTVAFCNTGHWAATDWFVLSEVLERPDVKLYPGSMVEWSQADTPLPMANEPGRLGQLRIQLMSWAHRNLGTRAP